MYHSSNLIGKGLRLYGITIYLWPSYSVNDLCCTFICLKRLLIIPKHFE